MAEADELVNLDTYFAEMIAAKLRAFKEQEVGHPGDYTKEGWDAKLESIIVPLERYAERWNHGFEMENEIVRAGQKAIKDLGEIFPSLWI